MSNARLMKPLFYDGNFNRDGKKMRAVFEREISDGTVSYRLWRSDGKPDIQYPRAENDNYLLYAEIRDYLVPLRITDFYLIDHAGYPAAVAELYGNVPLRTQGWINEKLTSVTIENGKCEHLRYMRAKGAQCSQRFFDCMSELIHNVCAETEG